MAPLSSDLFSCPSRAHCTVASAALLSASCPTQVRDTVYCGTFCLYLIPLLFREAESLVSMLLPLSSLSLSCPVPRRPPLFAGLAWVERPQSGASREQTRVSLTASHIHTAQRAQTQRAHPFTFSIQQVHINEFMLICAVEAHLFLQLTNQRNTVLSFSSLSFYSVYSATPIQKGGRSQWSCGKPFLCTEKQAIETW